MTRAAFVRRITVDPSRSARERLAFLAVGPVDLRLSSPLTILVGENGCGKTTLLEAIAARCSIRPAGGRSYTETEDERAATVLSDAVVVELSCSPRRMDGLFIRADRLHESATGMAPGGKVRMATTGEWRELSEQSRGESMLSLLQAQLNASTGRLFLLDEPEVALSPQRQMALLCLLDEVHRDGRSQVIMATHSPMLMAHPAADILWLDENGINRRKLEEVAHWQLMRRLMANPADFCARLFR